jgi:hypothetical protein
MGWICRKKVIPKKTAWIVKNMKKNIKAIKKQGYVDKKVQKKIRNK